MPRPLVDMKYQTEQEGFWAGAFGDAYVDRNAGEAVRASKTAFWSRVLQGTRGVERILELGANIGLNLHALRWLLPSAELSAVEINTHAADVLRSSGVCTEVLTTSILDFIPARAYDLAFTMGVLIHIAPDALPKVYDTLYAASNRYIVIGEYYNPTPVALPYRGEDDRLFKRDFAGDMLDRFKKLKLVDYGFIYRRDNNFGLDDVTWFLLEKC